MLAIAIWKLFHGNTVCATIASYICHPDELRLSLHLLTQFSQFSKLKLWLRFIFFVKFSFHGGSCNKEAPEITHTCCPQSWLWCIIASKIFQKLIWALLWHLVQRLFLDTLTLYKCQYLFSQVKLQGGWKVLVVIHYERKIRFSSECWIIQSCPYRLLLFLDARRSDIFLPISISQDLGTRR